VADTDRSGAGQLILAVERLGGDALFIDKSASAVRPSVAPDGEPLVEEFTLLQASALKLMRLQLAIARNERLAAAEAVDGLLGLDRRLGEFLAAFPPAAIAAASPVESTMT
jgi:hypothetical protein